jgi:hypothetical protein
VVLAVALLGAAVARGHPRGLAAAMVAAAIAQLLAFLILLVAGVGFTGPITIFFAAFWLAAAWLFRKAADTRPAAATVARAAEVTRRS